MHRRAAGCLARVGVPRTLPPCDRVVSTASSTSSLRTGRQVREAAEEGDDVLHGEVFAAIDLCSVSDADV